jgi:arsenical pump membrane protein
VARFRSDPETSLRTAGRREGSSGGDRVGGRAVISQTDAATWGIAALATFGVIARPWHLPEFIWAVAGAVLLVLLDLLPWPDALAAAGKGTDVYFFLIGMMLLAEVARQEGLFDWLAAQAVRHSKGSAKRLFLI